ncbi:MAG: LAGLIDADG family homing endonuclease, partial [Candidatus Heimdallarchaeaceae archaeon]
PSTIKAVKKLMNKKRVPELLDKGILRSKHGVYVYRDGTIRFDATDAVLTHFKPSEIGITIQKLRDIGYTIDINGNILESPDQLVEMKIQDIILNIEGGKHLVRTANFIDELLEKVYGLPKYYKAKEPSDLIGHIIIGLAPHTSAGIVGRLIGFTQAKVNFAHPYWHAAKRRNCFPGETTILVEIDGVPIKLPIKQLYEEFYENEIFDKQVFVKNKPKRNIKVYSFDKNNPSVKLTEIIDVIKAPSTDHLVRFNLFTGRSFETTPHHPISVFSDGKIVEKQALEIKENDFFILPNIVIESEDIDVFDLLVEFSKPQYQSIWNELMVRGIKSFSKKLVDKEGLLKTADKIGINKKTLHNYYSDRDSIPFNVLKDLLHSNNLTIQQVPDCYLGFKRDHTFVNRKLKVNNSFMKLIGYYLSEGFCRKGNRAYQVDFAVTEDDLRKDMLNAINSTFGSGFRPYMDKNRITISSRVLYHFFSDVLKLEPFSRNKRIPPIFLKLPKEKLRNLLAAYFSGDGGIDRSHKIVVCNSFSNDLINDLDFLLLRFGIFSSISSHTKNSNTEFKLRIRGENVFKFEKEIGFISKRKAKLLQTVVKEKKTRPQKTYKGHRLLKIQSIEHLQSKDEFVYSLNAKDFHTVFVNENIVTHQCDGDEDSILLALDAFLNFSKEYLPNIRGGQMDAPLILVANINPHEVDDESHNVDTTVKYPLEFYEATLNRVSAKEVLPLIDLIRNRLADESAYEGFLFSHNTAKIFDGPESTSYKNLKTMDDKVNAQLLVASKIRAVDVEDVATRIVVNHFIPDLIGNLRRFGAQKIRCTSCNKTYRRIPLGGVCTKCGSDSLNLTVHVKSVIKYFSMASLLVQKYDLSSYLKNRLEVLKYNFKTLFGDIDANQEDSEKQIKQVVKLQDYFLKYESKSK